MTTRPQADDSANLQSVKLRYVFIATLSYSDMPDSVVAVFGHLEAAQQILQDCAQAEYNMATTALEWTERMELGYVVHKLYVTVLPRRNITLVGSVTRVPFIAAAPAETNGGGDHE